MGESGDILMPKCVHTMARGLCVRVRSFFAMLKRSPALFVRGQVLLFAMLLACGMSMCGGIL